MERQRRNEQRRVRECKGGGGGGGGEKRGREGSEGMRQSLHILLHRGHECGDGRRAIGGDVADRIEPVVQVRHGRAGVV